MVFKVLHNLIPPHLSTPTFSFIGTPKTHTKVFHFPWTLSSCASPTQASKPPSRPSHPPLPRRSVGYVTKKQVFRNQKHLAWISTLSPLRCHRGQVTWLLWTWISSQTKRWCGNVAFHGAFVRIKCKRVCESPLYTEGTVQITTGIRSF